MSVDSDTIAAIARLSMLEVSEEELPSLTQRFNDILALFERMQAVDTDGVEPMAHPLDATQTLRDDIVSEIDQRDLLQRVAPLVRDGLYLVPRVVE